MTTFRPVDGQANGKRAPTEKARHVSSRLAPLDDWHWHWHWHWNCCFRSTCSSLTPPQLTSVAVPVVHPADGRLHHATLAVCRDGGDSSGFWPQRRAAWPKDVCMCNNKVRDYHELLAARPPSPSPLPLPTVLYGTSYGTSVSHIASGNRRTLIVRACADRATAVCNVARDMPAADSTHADRTFDKPHACIHRANRCRPTRCRLAKSRNAFASRAVRDGWMAFTTVLSGGRFAGNSKYRGRRRESVASRTNSAPCYRLNALT